MIDIKCKIWFEENGEPIMGSGRIKLLLAIDSFGSISEAAKQMNMSYKKAWKLIKTINENHGTALIERTTGGKGGGGTVITSEGKRIIAQYEMVKNKMKERISILQEEINALP